MKLIERCPEMAAENGEKPVVLVPTMGALHDGHATLIREARTIAGDSGTVVVSIFVNPTQFAPGEDFEDYPRDLDADRKMCEEAGADVIFYPAADEMYSGDASIEIVESSLSQILCGKSRPTHFAGVCTVVAKLFNLVRPDIAVFGKKDYQQLAIIRRMVRDLNFNVDIYGVETVREADGLAMSSRNRYLNEDERAQAPAIRKALLEVDMSKRAAYLVAEIKRKLRKHAPAGKVDYIELVDAETLERVSGVADRPAVFAAAVFFGETRLIDNLEVSPPE